MNRFPSYAESMATLDPWSTVLLYTDGLVEGPELPLGEGLDGLRSTAESSPREPEGLCRTLLASVDSRAGFRDDLALLAIQLTPPGETLCPGASGQAVIAWPRCAVRWPSGCG